MVSEAVSDAAWSQWFGTPLGIAITSIVTLVGLPLAVYGILRTVRASAAARDATRHTKMLLRVSDLRQAFETTSGLGRQINELDQRHGSSSATMRRLGSSWLDAEARVFGLVRDVQHVAEAEAFRKEMLTAATEMKLAIRQAANDSWPRYRLHTLKRKLHAYAEAGEAMIRAADDEVLNA